MSDEGEAIKKEFIKGIIESYVDKKSWRIAENASAKWSYSGSNFRNRRILWLIYGHGSID